MSSTPYEFDRCTVEELSCGIIRPSDASLPISSLAVFCHGFGASGDDLIGLAQEFLQIAAPEKGTMLVFPEAPLSLDEQGMPGARAWWLLSIQRLISAIEDGHYELVREEEPAGIDDAREKLSATIQSLLAETGLDESRLMLGGFSQGAMLSMDVACRGLAKPPANLVLYSGCLICEKTWRKEATRLNGTKILQSHGRLDPILPLQIGYWLKELLEATHNEVDFVEFTGVHTIPMEAIEKTAHLLAELTAAPA